MNLCGSLAEKAAFVTRFRLHCSVVCGAPMYVPRVLPRVRFGHLTLLHALLSIMMPPYDTPMHCCTLGTRDTVVRSRDTVLTAPSHNYSHFYITVETV